MDKKIDNIWVNFRHFLGNRKSQDEFFKYIYNQIKVTHEDWTIRFKYILFYAYELW